MIVSEEIMNSVKAVIDAETDDFLELTRIAGLDPAKDFIGTDLTGVDFSTHDLSAFDFTDTLLDDDAMARVSGLPKGVPAYCAA